MNPGTVLAIAGVMSALFLMWIMGWILLWFLPRNPELLRRVASDHFLAVTGTPLAALAAIVVVVTFRATIEGTIAVTAFGFEFKGPSGPTLLQMRWLGISAEKGCSHFWKQLPWRPLASSNPIWRQGCSGSH